MSVPQFDRKTSAIIVFVAWMLHLLTIGLIALHTQNRILFGYVVGSISATVAVRYIMKQLVAYKLQQIVDSGPISGSDESSE